MRTRDPQWGIRLQDALDHVRLSQSGLARILSREYRPTHATQVSKWCRGVIPNRGLDLVPVLSRVLGVPVRDLIPGLGPPPKLPDEVDTLG